MCIRFYCMSKMFTSTSTLNNFFVSPFPIELYLFWNKCTSLSPQPYVSMILSRLQSFHNLRLGPKPVLPHKPWALDTGTSWMAPIQPKVRHFCTISILSLKFRAFELYLYSKARFNTFFLRFSKYALPSWRCLKLLIDHLSLDETHPMFWNVFCSYAVSDSSCRAGQAHYKIWWA